MHSVEEGSDGGVGFGAASRGQGFDSVPAQAVACNSGKGRVCAGRPGMTGSRSLTAEPPSLIPDVPETLQVTWCHSVHSL